MPRLATSTWQGAGLTTYAHKFNELIHDWPAEAARLRAFLKAKIKEDPEYMDCLVDPC